MVGELTSAIANNDLPGAKTVTYNLYAYTVKQYDAGALIGGQGATTRSRVLTFIEAIFRYATLTPPPLTDAALGPNAAIGVLPQTAPTTDVLTRTKISGVRIPAGAVSEAASVIITPITTPFAPTEGPLLTGDDQYPAFLEVQVFPATAVIGQDVIVGACQAASGPFAPPDPSRLRLAHNVSPNTFGSIAVLPLVAVPFALDCGNVSFSSALPRPSGVLAQLASAIGRRLAPAIDKLLPTPAYAAMLATSGIGGSTRNFSPFGAVDVGFRTYRYAQGAAGLLPGFEQATEPAGLSGGYAPFGSGSVSSLTCPLDPTVRTSWTAGKPGNPSDLVVRRRVALDARGITDLTISVAIDNDIQVFVNGTDITASAGSANYSSGFQTYNSCAAAGSFVFRAPAALLHEGQNLIAARARDRGKVSYLDLVVSAAAGQ